MSFFNKKTDRSNKIKLEMENVRGSNKESYIMSSQLIQFYRMLVYVSNESRFMIFVHFIMHFF